MQAKTALYVALAAVAVAFSIFWFRHARAKWAGWPTPAQLAIGAVTDFFDTLGIGSFATTTSLFKFGRAVEDDANIPGTMNVGHTVPTFAEAFIFILAVEVDLSTLVDNRCQMHAPPLTIAGTRETLALLKQHFFNGLLWPDFTRIPTQGEPTIRYLELEPERRVEIAGHGVRAVLVSHTIEAAAFVIEGPGGSIAYSGDTGPTERLWEVLNELPDLKALLMEVSFPNHEQGLATSSGHHTPQTLALELRKYRAPEVLPTLLYHIKPVFQAVVERECAALKGLSLEVLQLGDHFVLL